MNAVLERARAARDALAKAQAKEANKRPAYDDGRTIPMRGDAVYDLARGMFGMGAVVRGEVAAGRGGLIVRVTGTTDVFGGSVKQKTLPLSKSWTLIGEEHPTTAQNRIAAERIERDAAAFRQANETRLAEAEARNGSLDLATVQLGDVLESPDGVLVVVGERDARGSIYVYELSDPDEAPRGIGSERGYRARPDVEVPTDGSHMIRKDDVQFAKFEDGYQEVAYNWDTERYERVDGGSSIIDSVAQLDGLGAIERARTAAALNARLSDLPGSTGLARLRLAREIRELVEKLGGGAAPAAAENKVLRAIVDGRHDGESLAELFGMIQENIGGEDFDLQQAAVTHWAELEAGEKAGAVPARPLIERMDMARDLLKLAGKIEAASGDAIAVRVMLGRRVAAIRRRLLGLPGASSLDDFMASPEAAQAAMRAEWEAHRNAPLPKRVKTAAYLRDIANMLRIIGVSEERAGVSSGTAFDRDLLDEFATLLGAPHTPAVTDPLIDESLEASKHFTEPMRGQLAEARAIGERYKAALSDLSVVNPALAERAKLARDIANSSHARMLTMSRKLRSGEATQSEYEEAMAVWRSATEAVLEPVNDEIAALQKTMHAEMQEAYAAPGRKVIESILDHSTIKPEDAMAWANAQEITKAAVARFKKIGYAVDQVRRDMAEFYRITNGRVASVRINSNGSRRANATDIEAHGKVGTINLDSNFDKRVLWHELAHHMEADPVAKMAAGRFIRRRAVDSKAYSLRSLTGNNGYRSNEAAFKDHFFSPYVGKIYSDGITEVFSMGVESLSNPELLGRRMAEDHETLDFVSGFLRLPFDPLARAHMGLREIMQEMNGEVDEARENVVEAKIKALAASAQLIADTDKAWLKENLAGWMYERDEYKQIGRFADSEQYVMAGKGRDPTTWRKVAGFWLIRQNGVNGFHREFVSGKDINVVKAIWAIYLKVGVLYRATDLTEAFFRKNPSL